MKLEENRLRGSGDSWEEVLGVYIIKIHCIHI